MYTYTYIYIYIYRYTYIHILINIYAMHDEAYIYIMEINGDGKWIVTTVAYTVTCIATHVWDVPQ